MVLLFFFFFPAFRERRSQDPRELQVDAFHLAISRLLPTLWKQNRITLSRAALPLLYTRAFSLLPIQHSPTPLPLTMAQLSPNVVRRGDETRKDIEVALHLRRCHPPSTSPKSKKLSSSTLSSSPSLQDYDAFLQSVSDQIASQLRKQQHAVRKDSACPSCSPRLGGSDNGSR